MYVASRLFCFLVFFVNLAAYATGSDCQEHQCLAVVDAGTSGSRLHIYAYDVEQTNTPINIKELWSKKIKPGFATLETDQTSIDSYLTSLFSGTPVTNLPVYFYATAGMRLLPQPRQQLFYSLLQQWFAKQTQWYLQSAKTITGKDEGIFAWLAVNYQNGVFNVAQADYVGVMDMGGSSVQIVFPVKEIAGIDKTELQQLELYGRRLQLFIHSFLGLGQTEVTHQFLDVASCFANDYLLPTGFTGAGDAYSCAAEISSLMNDVHHVNRIVQSVIGANPVNNWYVMGGMAELAQTKPFQFTSYQFTNQTLLKQADELVCHQQWPTVYAQYPNNEYLYGYCIFPSYYYALMVDGYGIQPQQPISYRPSNQQGSDWTLGVVLYSRKISKFATDIFSTH
jgi:GDA1/CD39 (nucleoside phosphatase) family